MTDPVTTRIEDGIAIVTVDNPPVNALGKAVREGLVREIEGAAARDDVRAIVLRAAGRTFPAGADIREFGREPEPPFLPDVCNRIEAVGKIVVAAVHGTVLGGGLEVALGAHYRIAADSARLGLPEVNLGLLPGAGATQRVPRITGAAPALDLMLSGKPIGAGKAASMGLVDKVVPAAELDAAALAYARALLAEGAAPRATSARTDGIADTEAFRAAIEARRAEVERAHPDLIGPRRIVAAVEGALTLPFAEGLAQERAFFRECLATAQSAGHRHAFFAERQAAKVPGLAGVTPRPIARMGVVGGGTMGAGIAVAALQAGLPVVMVERDAESIARGQRAVEMLLARNVERGRMTSQAMAETMARFSGATDYAAFAECDLVIEAVFEEMEVKRAVLGALDGALRPGAIIASNTSYLDLDALAAMTSRPADVLGLHFFSPANVMRLLEVVPGAETAPDVLAAGFALGKRLGKVSVRAGVCEGFIGNRMLVAYRQAADYMMLDGASPYEIDAAVRAFGYPIGPYQMMDMAGGDIGWARRKRVKPWENTARRYNPVADRLCEKGWFGQKTERGFYRYEDGARRGAEDPEVLAIIDAARAEAGVTPRALTQQEIVRRYLAAMANEGARIVEEGIALRPSDVDVVKLMGYGFPRWQGGPMHWADTVGLGALREDLARFAAEGDAWLWQPAALLARLAEESGSFGDLNG